MERSDEIRMNPLPTKTWHWLNMNDTAFPVHGPLQPCRVTLDKAASQIPDNSLDMAWNSQQTGAGQQAAARFASPGLTRYQLDSAEEETVRAAICQGAAEETGGELFVTAEQGACLTVIEMFSEGDAHPGSLWFRTLIQLEQDSRVRLIQIFMPGVGQSLLNDVEAACAQRSQFEVVQLFVGEGDLYNAVQTELRQDRAAVDMTIGYLGQRLQKLDINLVVNHWGRKTNSRIEAAGTLKDAARKLLRGSIDFKRGSSESVGTETEQVLLLSDSVVNQTIPLILCAEEDVEGTHGATIGELDADTLFYFACRGIDREQAEKIMTRGRLMAVCHKIGDEETEKVVQEKLAEVMADAAE